MARAVESQPHPRNIYATINPPGAQPAMLRKIATTLIITSAIALAGCGYSPGTRALTGGAIGAGGGAILGSATGIGAGTGALVGAGVGAGTGALTAR
jgi:osmotically inducible lipoprotein OsmB